MAEIFTTLGMVDESTLVKTEGFHDNDNETVNWQEWHFEGVLVKREVQMHLKHGFLQELSATF